MPELIAKGPEPSHRWRRAVPDDEVIRLGRSRAADWVVPWDKRISREHVEIWWRDNKLHVRRLATGRNPVFFRGDSTDEFTLAVGEHFVIGSTAFQLAADPTGIGSDRPSPVEQHSFRPGDLRRIRFRNAEQRLEVLWHLPELITNSRSDDEFTVGLVNLLLAGIPHAEAAALVECRPDAQAGEGAVKVLQWDRRRETSGRFRPSQRLVAQAIEHQESVLHVWSDLGSDDPAYTLSENLDWAFCTPVPGEACRGWGLYVAGSFSGTHVAGELSIGSGDDLKQDLRFAELVAELTGALRQVGLQQRRIAGLSQFFSPKVLETLEGEGSEQELATKQAQVTVLFCDLRGFSKEAEHSRGDLLGLLDRVSEALGVMTHHILEFGGVIGDFQGDAAMGFWGWPIATPDGPRDACLAALAISREFQRAANEPGHPLADFRVGIGIAHGPAVAGKIGTAHQVKVTVFGPVVNLASRLEGMTKQMRAPILLDEPAAEQVRKLSPTIARCRRLGRVLPYGMETPLMVSELLPPAGVDSVLTDQHVADYEGAVDALLAGRWSEALELLHALPAKDRARDFLTIFIAQHNYEPPSGWDGTIPMPSK